MLDAGSLSRSVKIRRRFLGARSGRACGPESAANVGATMGLLRPSANAGLWAAVGLLFIVALLGAAPVAPASPTASHVDHHLTADGHHDQLAFIDHGHIDASSTPVASEGAGDLMAPRSRPAFVVVGLIVAAALLWWPSPRHTPQVGRDPPRGSRVASPGRDVLARLCISRR